MGKISGEAGKEPKFPADEKVSAALARMAGRRVYLDTNVFVYFLERNPVFFPVAAPLLEAVEAGVIIGCTGDAALAETLVKPYQAENLVVVAQCKAFFATEGFLTILPHDAETFDLAAQLRAKRGLKFIDALHLATALRNGCTFFVTNDAGIQSDDAVTVIRLSALTPEG